MDAADVISRAGWDITARDFLLAFLRNFPDAYRRNMMITRQRGHPGILDGTFQVVTDAMLDDPAVWEIIVLISGWFTREQAWSILAELYEEYLTNPPEGRYELTPRLLSWIVDRHKEFLDEIEHKDRQVKLQAVTNKKANEKTERVQQEHKDLWVGRAQQNLEGANALLELGQQNQRAIQRPHVVQASLEEANLLVGLAQSDQQHVQRSAAVPAPFHPAAQQNQQQIQRAAAMRASREDTRTLSERAQPNQRQTQRSATVQAPSDSITHTTESLSTMAMTGTEASRTIDPRVPGLLEKLMQRRITDLALSQGRSPSPQGRSSRVTPQRHVPTREPSPSHPLPETLDGDQIDQRQAASSRFFADASHGTGASTHTSEHSSRSSAARGSTPPKGDQRQVSGADET